MSKNNYYSLSYDCVFKYIFGCNENIIFVEDFLEALYNLKKGSLKNKIKIVNSLKLSKENVMDKNYEVDVLIELPNGKVINLEMYRDFNKASKIKSFLYITHLIGNSLKVGEDYESIKDYEQINLVKNTEGKLRSYIEYKISDTDCHKEYLPNVFKINIIRVDKAKKSVYNINDRLSKWLRLINAEGYEEAKEIVKGDVILMEVLKRLKKFFSKNENNEIFSREVYQKNFERQLIKDSKMEGEKNKTLEITKNLLSENMDENTISRITGLPIKEINKLKMEM